jgi:AraC-like DNA-binding protein
MIKKKSLLAPTVETYHFLPRKYGRDLLLDVGRIESLKNFITGDTPHQLSFYEILFIEKGKGTFALDENKMSIEPGVVVFTSPGQVRQWNLVQAARGYTLFFEKDFLNLFFVDELFLYRFHFFHQYSRPTSLKLPGEQFLDVLKHVRDISCEFDHLQNDSGHLLRAILYQLLVILNRHYAATYGVENDTYIHPDFLRFRSLLEKNVVDDHYVSAYSKHLKISTAHLNKVCRQYSGLSAQQMIHHKLISEAKRQLRNSKSIKEIAYDFEFSDPSNFNRFFKKLTGVTPQQYRDNR